MNTERLFVCDAYDAGFNIDPINTDSQTTFDDLLLSRDASDYSLIDKTTLFSVNGLIYPSIAEAIGIRLKCAHNPLDESVLLIRTNQLGEITKSPFVADQITNPYNIDTATEQAIYINVDFNLLDCFYIVIIAGFLLIDDNRIEATGSNTLRIKHLSLDLDKKYLYSKLNYPIDNINVDSPNDKTINKSQFYNFEILKKLLLLENSFIVNFDRNLTCRKVALGSHRLPGRYETESVIDNLLISNTNKVINYRIGGNSEYPIIEGPNLISGLARDYSDQNEVWGITDFDPPFKKRYDDISKVILEPI